MIKIKKKIIIFLITILAVIFFIYVVFRQDFNDVLNYLKNISVFDFLTIIVVGTIYQLLEALGNFVLIKSQSPSFKYRQSAEMTLLGTFSNITTSSAGTIPLQSYYLYKRGIKAGKGIGLIILDSIFHKFSVFVYASVLIAFNFNWLVSANNNIMRYIFVGYFVYLLIIIGLILICSWQKIQDLLLWLINKLPDNEKWQKKKLDWQDNLKALYQESKIVLKNKKLCLKVIITNFFKLFWTYTIPLYCFYVVNIHDLSFSQIQILASIMLLITGVLPNVAGLGPPEVSFLLVFAPYLGIAKATSALIVYRITTCFYPFLMSAIVFLNLEKELLLQKK